MHDLLLSDGRAPARRTSLVFVIFVVSSKSTTSLTSEARRCGTCFFSTKICDDVT